MTQLRAASQVDDSSKIGKFGLGLKSVFHWCDIFWIFRITPNADETQWTLERFETVTLPGIEFKNVISAAAIEAVYDDVKRQVLSCQLGPEALVIFVGGVAQGLIGRHTGNTGAFLAGLTGMKNPVFNQYGLDSGCRRTHKTCLLVVFEKLTPSSAAALTLH